MKIEDVVLDLQKSIVATAGNSVRLEARCDALEFALRVLTKRSGFDEAKVGKLIRDVTATCYQNRLEQVEDMNPSLAASIDNRPPLPDISDDKL